MQFKKMFMKKSKIITLLIALIFVSCGRSAKQNDGNNDTLQLEQKDSIVENKILDNEFQQYLSYFSTINLPLSIEFCSGKFENDVEKLSLKKFEDDEDIKFHKGDYDYLAFGQIATDNYIATIKLTIGDCFAPYLTTYSYDGKIIDTKGIFITDMSDEGYSSKVTTLINSDLSIFITDSVTIYERDTISGEEIIIEKYVSYQKGKLLPTGKIELSDKKKQEIK